MAFHGERKAGRVAVGRYTFPPGTGAPRSSRDSWQTATGARLTQAAPPRAAAAQALYDHADPYAQEQQALFRARVLHYPVIRQRWVILLAKASRIQKQKDYLAALTEALDEETETSEPEEDSVIEEPEAEDQPVASRRCGESLVRTLQFFWICVVFLVNIIISSGKTGKRFVLAVARTDFARTFVVYTVWRCLNIFGGIAAKGAKASVYAAGIALIVEKLNIATIEDLYHIVLNHFT
jgi:hypothetical protein